ncbi:TonB-dependent receptor domain-containing protein [Deminuibacter soli]|nr:TonB-dependent receptor [Deminuibacter soli]
MILGSLLCCLLVKTWAQPAAGAGSVEGKVKDSLTGQPVEYATITLLAAGSAKAVNGATTDAAGNFSITEVAAGTYSIQIGFIGYSTQTLQRIVVAAGGTKKLGSITLYKEPAALQGVTVSATRSLVENKLDKMVYNAEKDISSQGGVATDVLKKVPQISVDADGNVELQGNGNIRFLINGKPSSVFGANLSDALQSIPASQIKSIEVITSPGARYDAEGTGGIINIILKKSTVRGINGNVNLTGGSRLENGSLNLNMREGNFGMNAFFSGNAQLRSTTRNSFERHATDSTNTMLLQNGSSEFTRNGFETGLGFDWNITPKDNLSGNIGFDHFGTHNNSTSYLQQYAKAGDDPLHTTTLAANRLRFNTVDWGLSYKKTFKKEGEELDVLYNASYGNNHVYYQQTQQTAAGAAFAGNSGDNPGTDREINIQADYTNPLSKSFTLETGVKGTFRSIASNAAVQALDVTNGEYLYDTAQSNQLQYKRKVYAAYVSGTFALFHHFLDVKAGTRYEYTHVDAAYSQAPDVTVPDFSTWAPSVTLLHKLNEEASVKLSYTHRIQRPDYRVLNPFVNTADPKNISHGDPLLKPEIGDNIEAGYNQSFKGGASLNAALFYRRSNHDIQPYVVYYPEYLVGDSTYTNTSVTTYANIGLEENTGLSLYGSVPITHALSLRSNVMLFERHIINRINTGNSISSFNYRINLNATYQVTSTLTAELFGNFNSARNEVQGRYPSFTFYNLAVRKQLWHTKGSLALTTTNLFNKYVNQLTAIRGTGFTQNTLRQIPFRSIGISFTYKFGKLSFKKEEEKHNDSGEPQL